MGKYKQKRKHIIDTLKAHQMRMEVERGLGDPLEYERYMSMLAVYDFVINLLEEEK